MTKLDNFQLTSHGIEHVRLETLSSPNLHKNASGGRARAQNVKSIRPSVIQTTCERGQNYPLNVSRVTHVSDKFYVLQVIVRTCFGFCYLQILENTKHRSV